MTWGHGRSDRKEGIETEMRLLEELITFAFGSLFFSVGPLIAFTAWQHVQEEYAGDYDKRIRYERYLLLGCGALLYTFYSASSK